ncbi:MAG: hypothetical protein PVF73_04920, partial [Bacteroidales bacterium]
MIQLTLFDIDKSDKKQSLSKRKIKWSYSKREFLRQCLRKYYFHYYGSNLKLALKEKRKEDIRYYKSFSNKYLVFGDIIHKIIAYRILQYKKGNNWDEAAIKSFGYSKVNDAIIASENINRNKEFSEHDNIFMEIIFNEESSEKLRQEGYAKIDSSIENLYNSSNFNALVHGS